MIEIKWNAEGKKTHTTDWALTSMFWMLFCWPGMASHLLINWIVAELVQYIFCTQHWTGERRCIYKISKEIDNKCGKSEQTEEKDMFDSISFVLRALCGEHCFFLSTSSSSSWNHAISRALNTSSFTAAMSQSFWPISFGYEVKTNWKCMPILNKTKDIQRKPSNVR